MKLINKYSYLIPYLYFLSIIIYLFTDSNQNSGIFAYPILLLAIPFLWQLIKPNKQLNSILGISFACLSSYLILAFLSDVFDIISFNIKTKQFILIGGSFVVANFIMSLWIIRNSLKRAF